MRKRTSLNAWAVVIAYFIISLPQRNLPLYDGFTRRLRKERMIPGTFLRSDDVWKVEDSANHLSAGDREFLIHPTYGATVKTALNPTLVSESASKIQGKKPFDWMMDEQFSNLQLLAQHFEWFQDPFDKMTKDGREMQWRQITEHEKPEMVALPDNLDDKYTPIQRFMVIRALRGDRVLQAGMCFVTSVLGKRYTSELSLDLPYTYRQSDCRTPIVLLYTQEANMVEKLVTEGAERKQVEIQIVALCNTGSNEERMARKLIHRAMQQGSWVLLHNAHNSPRLLSALDSLMHDTKTVDSEFRLWVSIIPTGNIPSTLLQSAVKVVADSPKQSLDLAVREFQDTADMNAGGSSRSIQWNGLRYMLSEVVYGSCVSDDFDRQGLSAIIDYWVSPAAVKKEFEAAKTKYKLPSALFTSSVRMTNVLSGSSAITCSQVTGYQSVKQGCRVDLHRGLNILFDIRRTQHYDETDVVQYNSLLCQCMQKAMDKNHMWFAVEKMGICFTKDVSLSTYLTE
ncbi:predicted protein [Nematostella vectensis]|uniref:Uncharacterized protein n=1 Tax=Nematostella vectensis TaxID=45351 RepID=A7T405_NEMVE|nr:predicted protein [Nematostella vectensis]|eukprot:XP_001621409.1 hypothetical protein NEMVEDRAFT_v1g222026 [Nematostella vectensis]